MLLVGIVASFLVSCGGDSKRVTSTPPIPTPTRTPTAINVDWAKLEKIVWVAYSPTNADPNKGVEATPESIRADLAVLRKAGFTGLVTYSSTGVMGHELPALAQSEGFQALIMGIGDPSNREEIAAAKAAATLPVVLGFCVGNEGLGTRYQMPALSAAIQDLRQATNKPAVTTEQIDDYADPDLLQLGDWVFPNAHPYFHGQLDPTAAVKWTQAAYDELKRSGRFVAFKEVGLPTAGDPQGKMSEAVQDEYYEALAKTDVRFVYFEAFDQPWKTELPIEPHWGIFHSDRTPKRLGARLWGIGPSPSATPSAPAPQTLVTATAQAPTVQATGAPLFYVYQDADSPGNHYTPSGYMGDVGDIHLDPAFVNNPHSGRTSIRSVYDARGKGPNTCEYKAPCKWAGVYWQEPPNNWGKDEFWKDRGFDLSAYNRLTFWARAEQPTQIEFKVGGIAGAYGDSLVYPRTIAARLTPNWQRFEIDLSGADLRHVIGGFVWTTDWAANPGGAAFYLDDIRFEQK